jgi:ribonuclease D
MIRTATDLSALVKKWKRLSAVGLDTEFVRVRTFYQILGLIQVYDGRNSYLIDPMAVKDLRPFLDLLQNERVTKIIHSCSEDLEVFYHLGGALPRPIFDTQIAAVFLGHGYPISYQKLVHDLFGVHIPKHQTRTDWTQRPLTPEQIEYAGLDVAYLIRAYRIFQGKLRQNGRTSWAAEEFEKLDDASRFIPDDDHYYRQIKGVGRLTPRELSVLRELTAWREKEARKRDRPRNFIIHDSVLLVLAEDQPAKSAELRSIRGIGPKTVRRNGETILNLIRNGLKVPDGKLPRPVRQNIDTRRYEEEIEAVKTAIRETAEELDIPKEFLAQRSVILKLIKHVKIDGKKGLPKELQGWRREAIGEKLLDILNRRGKTIVHENIANQ